MIHLSDGSCVEAEHIVLATGNEAPAGLPGSVELQNHPAWIGNPWQPWEHRLPASGGTVVLLGTGLTTVDAIITLRTLGWQGIVQAVSRNGWLPHSHFRGIDYPDFPPADVDLATLGLTKLMGLMEQHCARLRELNANPAIIIDKMRAHTQRIWRNFTLDERREFARHHSARWNVLRHRIAPEIHAQLQPPPSLPDNCAFTPRAHRTRRRGVETQRCASQLGGGKTLIGDLVINATGPHAKLTATPSVLLQNLLKRGLVVPDDMEMGVRVDVDHTILDGDGQRSNFLLALGPLLRGTLWETIAVPELRGQARRVAETLLDHPASPAASEEEIMMEYMI